MKAKDVGFVVGELSNIVEQLNNLLSSDKLEGAEELSSILFKMRDAFKKIKEKLDNTTIEVKIVEIKETRL